MFLQCFFMNIHSSPKKYICIYVHIYGFSFILLKQRHLRLYVYLYMVGGTIFHIISVVGTLTTVVTGDVEPNECLKVTHNLEKN